MKLELEKKKIELKESRNTLDETEKIKNEMIEELNKELKDSWNSCKERGCRKGIYQSKVYQQQSNNIIKGWNQRVQGRSCEAKGGEAHFQK